MDDVLKGGGRETADAIYQKERQQNSFSLRNNNIELAPALSRKKEPAGYNKKKKTQRVRNKSKNQWLAPRSFL